MSFSEQTDPSAERTNEPSLYSRLLNEQSSAGSTLEYVRQLGMGYQENQEHNPNLLQLQRMAGVVTNPTNEPTFPTHLTNAFYWGEILAYRAQDIESGGEWGKIAYSLLNGALSEQIDRARFYLEAPEQDPETGEFTAPEYSDREMLQLTSDLLVGELEEVEAECMPPEMESLIVRMSDELSEIPEEQWYMILGFRHVTTAVVQTVVDTEVWNNSVEAEEEAQRELAREVQQEMKKRMKLEKRFIKLMDKNNVDDVQGRELVSVDDVRERIMGSYNDHIAAYGPYDVTDEDETDRVATFLMQAMNRDFIEVDSIEADDFLQVSGTALFTLYDEEMHSHGLFMLANKEVLKGTVDVLAIAETPSADTIQHLREGHIDADGLQDDKDPLGVVLLLKDPVFVDREGIHKQIGEDYTAGLVMANPYMNMSKLVL